MVLHLNKLESMFCAKFGYIGPVVLKRRFLNFVNVFSVFRNYLPSEKGSALHWHKHALCQIQLKLTKWFWRKRFLNFFNVFSLFHNYVPLEKDRALHLHKFESSSPKHALCQIWLTMTTTTDNRQILIRNAHFSLQLR